MVSSANSVQDQIYGNWSLSTWAAEDLSKRNKEHAFLISNEDSPADFTLLAPTQATEPTAMVAKTTSCQLEALTTSETLHQIGIHHFILEQLNDTNTYDTRPVKAIWVCPEDYHLFLASKIFNRYAPAVLVNEELSFEEYNHIMESHKVLALPTDTVHQLCCNVASAKLNRPLTEGEILGLVAPTAKENTLAPRYYNLMTDSRKRSIFINSNSCWIPRKLAWSDLNTTGDWETLDFHVYSKDSKRKTLKKDAPEFHSVYISRDQIGEDLISDLENMGLNFITLTHSAFDLDHHLNARWRETIMAVFISVEDYEQIIAPKLCTKISEIAQYNHALAADIEAKFPSNEDGLMKQSLWLNLFWNAVMCKMNWILTDEEKAALIPAKSSPQKAILRLEQRLKELEGIEGQESELAVIIAKIEKLSD